ncbi:MAG: c-type cytochrome [Candidatus Acidiferrales bacterium]
MNGSKARKSGAGFVWALVAVFVVITGAIALAVISSRPRWNAPPEVKAEKNPVPADAASLAEASEIYGKHCVSCHGEKGDGKGKRAPRLSVAPSDFTDAHALGQLTDGEIFWKIGAGRRPMPSFGSRLSEKQRWELVGYIREFAAQPPAPTPAAGATPAAATVKP